jgi:6-pyruvoyl-tetrahydropterin synthase
MSTITVRTQFEGLHYWDSAPEKVAFLRNMHRHIFKIEVSVDVKHDDRDTEFFIFKNDIDVFLKNIGEQYHPEMATLRNLGGRSCEMIANMINEYVISKYNKSITFVRTKVQEDDENAGISEETTT